MDKDNKVKRIYIAGPITGIENYQARFERAERWLLGKGYAPVNPAKMFEQPAECYEYDREDILKVCAAIIDRMADGIMLLPGWEKSDGAKRELKHVLNFCPHFEIIEGDGTE